MSNIHNQLLAMYARQARNMDYGRSGYSAGGVGFNWMDPRTGGAYIGAKVKKQALLRGNKKIKNASLDVLLKNLKSGKKEKNPVILKRGKNLVEVDIGKEPSERSKFVRLFYKIRKEHGIRVPALDAKGAAAAWKEYQKERHVSAEDLIRQIMSSNPSAQPVEYADSDSDNQDLADQVTNLSQPQDVAEEKVEQLVQNAIELKEEEAELIQEAKEIKSEDPQKAAELMQEAKEIKQEVKEIMEELKEAAELMPNDDSGDVDVDEEEAQGRGISQRIKRVYRKDKSKRRAVFNVNDELGNKKKVLTASMLRSLKKKYPRSFISDEVDISPSVDEVKEWAKRNDYKLVKKASKKVKGGNFDDIMKGANRLYQNLDSYLRDKFDEIKRR